MKLKRLMIVLLTACLIISQVSVVKAEEITEDMNISVTNYTGNKIKNKNVVTWYTLSAERNKDNTIAVG